MMIVSLNVHSKYLREKRHKRSGKDGIPSTALQRKPMYICMYTTSVYTKVILHKHTCMHRCTIFSNQTDEARAHWTHLHQ